MGDLLKSSIQIFTTPLFDIGGSQFSLASIGEIIFLIITVIASSMVLSELARKTVLSQLNRGLQEVIAVSIQYISIVLGVIFVLQSNGINLSSLTVFAGVLGIGIGFGLQNLASNFFSGLILLFEQTVKVGDYIELGQLKGTIEKITIRSTIVRTEDDVFVIVPNQKFMENDTINWSYGSKNCRIHVPITVAHDTDVLELTEALFASARNEPRVLTDPPPDVWFDSFGENGLNFQLLIWIDDPDENEVIRSSLNFRIAHELKTRNIKIPVPQRDLWVRNWPDALKTPAPPASPPTGSNPLPTPLPSGNNNTVPSYALSHYSLRDLLRRISFFENCSDAELIAIIASGYRNEYSADEIIFQENDPSESFYLILSGSVEVYSEKSGQQIAVLKEGDFFGEIAVLVGTPRTATVRTLTNSILFVIDRKQLQKLLREYRSLGEQIAYKLSERQKMLVSMGLLSQLEVDRSEGAALHWVKERLNALFGIHL
jgi:small-conductance mechanosensitive channel/CRP-like cAMP-binding protein